MTTIDRLRLALANLNLGEVGYPKAVYFNGVKVADEVPNATVVEFIAAAFEGVPALVEEVAERTAASVACSKAMSEAQQRSDELKSENFRLLAQYGSQDVQAECLALLTAAGMGKPGHTNTLWGMTRDICAEFARLAGELAASLELNETMGFMGQGLADEIRKLKSKHPRAKKPKATEVKIWGRALTDTEVEKALGGKAVHGALKVYPKPKKPGKRRVKK